MRTKKMVFAYLFFEQAQLSGASESETAPDHQEPPWSS